MNSIRNAIESKLEWLYRDEKIYSRFQSGGLPDGLHPLLVGQPLFENAAYQIIEKCGAEAIPYLEEYRLYALFYRTLGVTLAYVAARSGIPSEIIRHIHSDETGADPSIFLTWVKNHPEVKPSMSDSLKKQLDRLYRRIQDIADFYNANKELPLLNYFDKDISHFRKRFFNYLEGRVIEQ